MAVEQKLMHAARRIVRSLVRILLRNGIASDALTELVRQTYVDVADQEFGIEGKRQTIARISVITGLNRKEVSRLRGLDPLDRADAVWRNRAAHVLASWLRDEAFLDRKGDPVDLAFSGDVPSFEALVKKHSGDMYPRSVADELLRTGAIEEVGGKLRMTKRGYVPSADPERIIDILGLDTAELMETIDHNLQAGEDDERLFQLKVLSDNVPVEYLDEFNAYSRRLSRPVLEELSRWLAERDRGQDWSGDDERVEVGLGIYQINRAARGRNRDEPDNQVES
ncbi:MAG: DUF6502 family protein [Gammaproteobacteria bacterium]|nr:DUF6502 family protein [Gammaproteobacteria bacterium]